ncbi:DedA family protein [Paenibacillus sp. FSL M8-0228]|uniref:DedA family protein n=1 Tax=Paenibacillus TaxID=44249 RepID=UPI0004229F97|nr:MULTISPECIES: DedA family protein [Paenibacillus]KEO80327.1 alkaline phosphatase [Paenibacillus polymyxa]MBO3283773.1 DedA family protein [Paenibacillus polymyxa]MBP1310070.1 membrane protein DedA with SNARE-associated domain [Paenibacillus sp. 1182]MCH6186439.1 DedA family protein [Paenibacillus polymyxa]MDY8091762.1 DedA family protein [Paenibacillus polymyxa]
MDVEYLISIIEQYGYAALFFSLWLGIVGLPIPDEVIVMTGGAVTGMGILHPLPAFLIVYLGVISGLSLGYVLGRTVGTPILERLRRKKKMDKYITFSEKLIHKYGNFTICISYLLPIVRHIIPYIVGINKMSFKRYALFSYSTGLIWTLIFFLLGRIFGDHVQAVGELIHRYGLQMALLVIMLTIIFFIMKLVWGKKTTEE